MDNIANLVEQTEFKQWRIYRRDIEYSEILLFAQTLMSDGEIRNINIYGRNVRITVSDRNAILTQYFGSDLDLIEPLQLFEMDFGLAHLFNIELNLSSSESGIATFCYRLQQNYARFSDEPDGMHKMGINPSICRGCHYHFASYGIVCAVHPSGPIDNFCSDRQSRGE